VSPTLYLFDRKGRVIFKPSTEVELDAVMEFALEQTGFEDIEEEDMDDVGTQLTLITEPNATKAVADAIVERFGLEVESLDIEWQPNSEVDVQQGEDLDKLDEMVEQLREMGAVQNVYLNAAEVSVANAVT
jgi:transcriptional/translational regulatory protein YebC/TACO1